jgi:hypothetical protein
LNEREKIFCCFINPDTPAMKWTYDNSEASSQNGSNKSTPEPPSINERRTNSWTMS